MTRLMRSEGSGATLLMTPVLTVLAMLAFAAPAIATPRYVDDSGNDANTPCTFPTAPCETIAQANTVAGLGDVIQLGGGTYPSAVLGQAPSLVGSNFNPPATAGASIIDTNAVFAINVDASIQPREIQGLTIRGSQTGIQVQSVVGTPTTLTIAGNVFQRDTEGTFGVADNLEPMVGIAAPSGAAPINATIESNTFAAAPGGVIDYEDIRDGIRDLSHPTVVLNTTIRNNTFDAYTEAISVSGAAAASDSQGLIGNSITRAYESNAATANSVIVSSSDAVIDSNTIVADTTNSGSGLLLQLGDSFVDTVAVRRTAVAGFDENALAPSSNLGLDSISVTDSLFASDEEPVQAGNLAGGLSLTGVTLPNPSASAFSIRASGTPLTVDSSILDDPIDSFGACTISFSRGPTTSGGACESFQTSAPAGYVNAAGGDFRLATGSAMIDVGNPAPPATALDLFGDPRALLGTPGCVLVPGRRDIGADEFVPQTGVGCPSPPSKVKKCKRKKGKGKKGAAAPKKKKKKCKKKGKKKN